jgi:hypothetical protein
MSKPLGFASSAAHAGVQIADLLAGVTAALPGGRAELAELGKRAEGHLHEDCVLPDFNLLDLDGDEAPVCWLVLEELATRADNGGDPLEGMEMVFATAKASLPEFRKFRSQGGSLPNRFTERRGAPVIE